MADLGDIFKEYLPLAGPAVSLIQGLFGKSAQDQYNEAQQANLQRSIAAIRANSAVRRARMQRLATQQSSLATQAGSRRAASVGATGDTSVFTDPDVSRIHAGLTESLRGIDESEQTDILNANAGVRDQPSYMFPHTADYLSNALGAAGNYFTSQGALQFSQGMETSRLASQNAMIDALRPRTNTPNYSDPSSGVDDSINRIRNGGRIF